MAERLSSEGATLANLNYSAFHWTLDLEQAPIRILYPSRLNEEINLALYDMALPKMQVSTTRPFLEYKAEVAALILEFKLAII